MTELTKLWNDILRELRKEYLDSSMSEEEIFSLILPKAIRRLYSEAYNQGHERGFNEAIKLSTK